MFDAASAGNPVGGVIQQTLTVQGGVFTTSLPLDPSSFPGADRWIEVRVRATPAGGSAVPEDTAPFAILERQRIQATPYAFRALSAATVESVPLRSLPPSVPVLDAGGRLSISLIPEAIARTSALGALDSSFQAALQSINATTLAAIAGLDVRQTQLLNTVALLEGRINALTQNNAQLQASLEVAVAPARSGWMAASTLPADPGLVADGFAVVSSFPAPGWMPISAASAPTARSAAASVWTGQEWIIWGGKVVGQQPTATGARLRPDLDAWTEITGLDAPSARSGHTAVWTGTQMIVWGGFGSEGSLNTGGRYTAQPQGWTSVSTVGAPSARSGHAAVWTGSRMIV
ncbi:MAG: hypothetical protein ACKPAH_09115, partial [Verrucomicrobiota bacterium]